MDQSVAAIKARPQDLAAVGVVATGAGIKVGNVDDDIDLTHAAFPGGTSVVDFSGAGLSGAKQHATGTSSVIVGNGGGVTGVAPGVTLQAAKVLSAESTAQAIFAQASSGFDVINMSLGFGTATNDSTFTKFLDWVVFSQDVVFTKSAGNKGTVGSTTITTPGDAFNIITVGATGRGSFDALGKFVPGADNGDFSRVAPFSSEGRTIDLRNKPDIVAPGVNIDVAKVGGGTIDQPGTSFAAPHVAGSAALLLEFAKKTPNHVTDHEVIKAILLNSADHGVKQKDGTKWQPTLPGIDPLDDQAGSGQLDVQNAFLNFKPKETVNPANTDPIAWDLNTVAANGMVDYDINMQLAGGSTIAATIVWDREISRTLGGDANKFLDDTYTVGNFANLDLFLVDNLGMELNLFDAMGYTSFSESPVDPTEHIFFQLPITSADYTIRVKNTSAFAQEFGFALLATPVPEPSTILLFGTGFGFLVLLQRHRKKRTHRSINDLSE